MALVFLTPPQPGRNPNLPPGSQSQASPTAARPPSPSTTPPRSPLFARFRGTPSRPPLLHRNSMPPPAPPTGSSRPSRQRSASSAAVPVQLPPPPPPQPQPQSPLEQPSARQQQPPLPPSPARELANPFTYLRTRRHASAGGTPNSANPAPAANPPPPAAHSRPLNLLHRRPSARDVPPPPPAAAPLPAAMPPPRPPPPANAPTHRLRLVPHLESARSLIFDPIVRHLPEGGAPIRIGRFTERRSNAPRDGEDGKIAFRSKVVSRGHAEVWCEPGGKMMLKDTSSSSGTFLNHIRLSSPNTESRAFALKDGDVIQLGVDYQGGTEEIYRCVKIRVELGRFVGGREAFNTNALAQINALAGPPAAAGPSSAAAGDAHEHLKKASITECSICISSVTVCQSLFIAPCSHVFHYKCIRPLVEVRYPGFVCPMCRSYADLEADVDDEGWDVEGEKEKPKEKPPVVSVPVQPALPPVVLPSEEQEDEDMDAQGEEEEEGEQEGDEEGVLNVEDDDDEQDVDLGDDPEEDEEDEEEDEEDELTNSHVAEPTSYFAQPVPIAGPSRSHPPTNPHTHQPHQNSFDAATPMNHLFLSTLADTGRGRSQHLSPGANSEFGSALSPVPSASSREAPAGSLDNNTIANTNNNSNNNNNNNNGGGGRGRKGKGKGKKRAQRSEEQDCDMTEGERPPRKKRARA